MKRPILLVVFLLSTPFYAFADCDELVNKAKDYYHHDFVAAKIGEKTYVLDQIGDDRFPVRYGLRECIDNKPHVVMGWDETASTTIDSLFWSDNLKRLFISTYEFSDSIKGSSWYVVENARLIQMVDGKYKDVADIHTRYYLDSEHHPIVLISHNAYVDATGIVKNFVNIPRYGVSETLPENNWYYTIGWDDGYEYVNVVKIELIEGELVATKSIHITESPSWFERVIVFIFGIDMLYKSDLFTDVLYYDANGGIIGVVFDYDEKKLSFYKDGKKIFLDVSDY
ncbi:MAG: hypothetical protein R3B60_00540 [Candidatus Paceibacterota bacterium]